MPAPTPPPDGLIQVRRMAYWSGNALPMNVLIDGVQVGSLMISQKAQYPVAIGDHAVQVRMFPNLSSEIMRVNVLPGAVMSLKCAVKSLGFGINLEFDGVPPSLAQSPSVSIVLLGTERVRAAIEDVSVPAGVTIRVSRSRTVEHSIEYAESGTTEGEMSAGLGGWLDVSIRKQIELSIGKAMKESETVSYEIELNGVNATRYQLAWTDVWRTGNVTIGKGSSSPFRVREAVELEVVAVL